MKRAIFLAFFIACGPFQLLAQKPAKKVLGDNPSSKISFADAKAFFPSFTKMKQVPQRGEFETDSEYRARMSTRIDTATTVILAVTTPPAFQGKNYRYDIDKLELTIYGGRPEDYESDSYKTVDATPIIVQSCDEDMGTYIATNAFGSAVSVHKTYSYDYVLNLTNLDFVPDSIYDRNDKTFYFRIYRSPKQAEKLSKSLLVGVAVRPLDYQRSNFERVYAKSPKIDSPTEFAKFNYSLDAQLLRIFLYDESAKTFLADYYVTNDSSVIRKRVSSSMDQQDTLKNSVPTQMVSDDSPPPDFVPYDREPIAETKVDAVYPEIAKRAGLEGNVFLKVWVDTKGTVREAVVIKSDAEIFNQAAKDAAMRWIFQPALNQGKPVSVWVSLPFRFRLPN